jgi:hypothetical protein
MSAYAASPACRCGPAPECQDFSQFLSFDERQRKTAKAVGLNLEGKMKNDNSACFTKDFTDFTEKIIVF